MIHRDRVPQPLHDGRGERDGNQSLQRERRMGDGGELWYVFVEAGGEELIVVVERVLWLVHRFSGEWAAEAEHFQNTPRPTRER
jgi:hypothetical protein